MPLTIKVGHRYRTRSGDVVEVVGEKKYTHAPKLYEGKFLTREIPSSQFYIATGRWGLQESEYDLIEEIPACVSCGEVATHECDEQAHFGQCGHWLCDNCEHDCQNGGHARK